MTPQIKERQPDEQDWYAARSCTHAHCPYLCEHPQPFLTPDGRMLCGRCYFVCGEASA